MNGAVEATNMNPNKILQKMASNHSNWHEKLPYALLAYRTSICTSISATLYSLVYETGTVLPIEAKILSLRILAEAQVPELEWAQTCHDQLNLIDGKRLQAINNE